MANTTQPNPIEELAREISSTQMELNKLQKSVRLTDVIDEVEDLETKMAGVLHVVEDLRKRGYVFEKALEDQSRSIHQRWKAIKPNVQMQIQFQANQLGRALPPIETKMAQLSSTSRNLVLARPLHSQVKTEVENLSRKAEAAESTLRGMYDELENEYDKLNQHLDDIDWMLSQLAQASFTLLPTESGIMAVKATLTNGPKADKDDPEGVLYLTDQRLIFEQKQEVATKKVLFITTERKTVQNLVFDIPVVMVEEIKPAKQGMFKNEDHLDIFFASGAPYRQVHLHLDGQDCNLWQGLINRAKIKDYDRDRAVAVDQAEVEKVKAAPTICPACGGSITKPVLRGQDTISCEYCGHVIRL